MMCGGSQTSSPVLVTDIARHIGFVEASGLNGQKGAMPDRRSVLRLVASLEQLDPNIKKAPLSTDQEQVA